MQHIMFLEKTSLWIFGERMRERTRSTFPDPNYATCKETYAKLMIYPGPNDVTEITDVLGIEPTVTQRKGEVITNSIGRTRVSVNSLWALSSEGKVSSKDLRDHLDWLIKMATRNPNGLRVIQDWNDIKMVVTCVWWSALGHGGPVLWPEQMKALAELNLECAFDVYFADE